MVWNENELAEAWMIVAAGKVDVEEWNVWEFLRQVFDASGSKSHSKDKFMRKLAMNRSTALAAKVVTHKTVTLDDDTLSKI